MLRLLLAAVACALAADGFFNNMASSFGLSGCGDYLAAVVISVLLTPLVAEAVA